MHQHARAIDANRRREFLQQEKCQQAIGDNSRRDFCQLAKSQQAIDASRHRAIDQQVDSIDGNSHRDFCQLAKSQQAIDGFAVELSQTTVCEIFALAKTDRPAG